MLYNRAVPGNIRHASYILWGLLLFLFTAGVLAAREASWMSGNSNPKDLLIELVTIEPGDELYTWWGHSGLIVTDTRSGESRFYNYGLFSFEQTNFFTNFAMGRLRFMVAPAPTKLELDHYSRRNRSITIQTLNIPPDMRLRIARFVEINVLPANREYLYDHYYDNCATRVRDILDTASFGALFEAGDVLADTTFRRITRRFSGSHFFADTLLMFLMGRSIDTPITVWETMFLPTELRDVIDGLSVQDAQDRSEPFVLETAVHNEAVGRKPIPEEAPSAVPLSLCLGGGTGIIVVSLAVLLRKKRRAGRIFFGVASGVTGLLLGLPGVALTFMSLFTDHTVTYWNENLALANPFTFLAFPLGIFTAAGFPRIGRITAWLWAVLAGIGVVYVALKAFPFFMQDNWQIIALIAPILAAVAFSGKKQL
ncbi:MAG: DUF4105 domain-containing protein [Spirochaetales bacterium]|nr:DUF4105 domain-containing protein [Spirochaetales bacterium]